MPEVYTGPTVSFTDKEGRKLFLTPDGRLHRTNPANASLTAAQAREYESILPQDVNEALGLKTKKGPNKRF